MERIERKQKPLPALVQSTLNINVELPKAYNANKPLVIDRVLIISTIALFLTVLLFFELSIATWMFALDSLPRGNTDANLAYGGFAADAGENTLLVADTRNGQTRLYRVDMTNGESALLTMGTISEVNYSNGWVYYLLTKDDRSNIYKMPVKGGSPVLLKEDCNHLMLIGGWLYYDSQGIIYKLKKNGSHETIITDEINSLISIRRLSYYYTTIFNEKQDFYALTITKSTLLAHDIASAAQDGKWIYVCQQDRINNSGYSPLLRIDTDKIRCAPFVDTPVSLPFPSGGLIYVNCAGGIYRMEKKGGELTKLSDDHYTTINAVGDWIIYRSQTSGKLMKMQPDGSQVKKFWQ